jgi:hypothetical protein
MIGLALSVEQQLCFFLFFFLLQERKKNSDIFFYLSRASLQLKRKLDFEPYNTRIQSEPFFLLAFLLYCLIGLDKR